jgi:DNA-binding response OmpR family regulator
VSLTYKEFQLLVLLASNPGRVYSRENLLSQVWGYDYLGGTRTVDVHVRRLRSKIESPDRSFIETIYLVGYRFKAVT